jgi:hypothetical protein
MVKSRRSKMQLAMVCELKGLGRIRVGVTPHQSIVDMAV